MREIKFRGWDEKEKRMYSPKELADLAGLWFEQSEDGSLEISLIEDSYGFRRQFKKMQYTGLKDKNGVEIYEGDIIDNHEEYHNKKVVNYDPHSCFFCLIDFDDWPDIMYNGEMFNQAGEGSNFSGRIEVVGNIFEGVDK